MRSFYTIGHSSHSLEHVVGLLQANEIEVLVDTRSYPYSKWVLHGGEFEGGGRVAWGFVSVHGRCGGWAA